MDGEVGGAVQDKRLPHIPEKAHFSAANVFTVNSGLADRDFEVILRPVPAVVVGKFENVMPEGVHPEREGIPRIHGFHRADIVFIEIVEAENAPAGGFEQDGVGRLRLLP